MQQHVSKYFALERGGGVKGQTVFSESRHVAY